MYRNLIRESMARQGRVGAAEPHHVEAWMRLEHSTLDGLSRDDFDREVRTALKCIRDAGIAESEALAESFGLTR